MSLDQTVTIDANDTIRLQNLLNDGQYAEAYQLLREINENSGGADATSAWLDKASSINSDDGSAVSEFVREATKEAGLQSGVAITDEFFQQVSDELAQEVIEGVIENGFIPSTDEIVAQDVSSVVDKLGLPPEGWAGTLGGSLPIEMYGLELPIDGEFYDMLFDDLQDRGIDSFREYMDVFGDVLDSNLAGANAATSALLENIWNDIDDILDEGEANVLNNLLSLSETLQESIDALFNWVATTVVARDPLILDLNGDGIQTLELSEGIYFDQNANGIKNLTEWISKFFCDALL